MRNIALIMLSSVGTLMMASAEPFLDQLLNLEQSKVSRDFHIDTDEWLTYGKFAFGSNNRTAQLELDFNSDLTIITDLDCASCRSRTYSSLESSYYLKPDHPGIKNLTYQRYKGMPISLFQGQMAKDLVCFNGAINHHNCTSRGDPGPEFFVATNISTNLNNQLFAGMMGLGVVPKSNYTSIIEYLK